MIKVRIGATRWRIPPDECAEALAEAAETGDLDRAATASGTLGFTRPAISRP
jgi:hypothetical protein